MPCRHSRSGTGLGPGEPSGHGGSNGSISAHKSSSTIHGRVVTHHKRSDHYVGHARPGHFGKILLRGLHTCSWLDSPLSVTEGIPVSRLPASIGDLVRSISNSGTRIVFTDITGPIASLISERELRELEDTFAIAESEQRKAGSSSFMPHDEAVQERPIDDGTGEDGEQHAPG